MLKRPFYKGMRESTELRIFTTQLHINKHHDQHGYSVGHGVYFFAPVCCTKNARVFKFFNIEILQSGNIYPKYLV